jgi:hypothetical protein
MLGRPRISNPIAFHHDNSVDEMASMLLDDTTTIPDPTKPVAAQRVESSAEDKDLPQLPELLFNGDDAWARRTGPVVTAAGNVNEIQFMDGSEAVGSCSSHMFGHSADHSTPPIPRRVSHSRAVDFPSIPSSQNSLRWLLSTISSILLGGQIKWNFNLLFCHTALAN